MSTSRKRNYHISNLQNSEGIDENQHNYKPKKHKIEDPGKIYWIFNDDHKSQKLITPEEIRLFVDDGIAPEGATRINFHDEYNAKVNTHSKHLYSNSCILDGFKSYGAAKSLIAEKYKIKISSKSCLGMRELSVCTKYKGCATVFNTYECHDYNIFIRENYDQKLSTAMINDLLTVEDYGKMIRQLSENMSNLHQDQTLVRFVVSEAILVFNDNKTGESTFKFEEFGTLKFISEFSDDESTSSGNELCDKIKSVNIDDSDKIEKINTEKGTHTIKDDIKLLGYLLQESQKTRISRLGDNLIDGITKDIYNLSNINTHPAFQKRVDYFLYMKLLDDHLIHLMKKKDFNLSILITKIHNRIGDFKIPSMVRDIAENYLTKKQRNTVDKYHLFFNMLLRLIHLIYTNAESITTKSSWRSKYPRFVNSETLIEQLHLDTIDLLARFHLVMLEFYDELEFKNEKLKSFFNI